MAEASYNVGVMLMLKEDIGQLPLAREYFRLGMIQNESMLQNQSIHDACAAKVVEIDALLLQEKEKKGHKEKEK